MREMTLSDPQLFGHRSLAELVTDHLRRAITGGTYAPGAHLVEREIAETLGVSSIPVREAFARLVEEGLVVRVPRRGAFVAPLSVEGVRDLTRTRIALEALAVELAIENWTPEAHAEAQAIVDGMREAARAGDRERFFRQDEAFHQLFWRTAKSETLLAIAQNLRGRISRFLREAIATDRRALEKSADDHQRWLDAVEAGDLDRARAEVEQQISSAAARIVQHIEESEPKAAGAPA
jgi:DNA-binding GntR family transcriptional regulator